MGNINPRPVFVPAPGTPTPCKKAETRWGSFYGYSSHRTMAEVMAEEATKRLQPRGGRFGRFKHCWGCVARSVCPWPNECPRCAEMAA